MGVEAGRVLFEQWIKQFERLNHWNYGLYELYEKSLSNLETTKL